ncbi:response regulator transcription factor [Streptomyces sp. NBC_00237]|uniref:response regulator n=1 Tax=Streptomyces sp. NBC_00237 TaxID=2975687 RepID=UPI0022526274|nr:response regulator transcription factor [Streptomyces sp. NBC_00237]MCX5206616.1 response regulator transcription factor [Streptomyces sp. NBC_00237]
MTPGTPPEAVSVLIVDDHPVVRAGLRGMLVGEPDIEVVGEAANADEALALTHALSPSVVLMDLRMPGGGVAATARITAEKPTSRVLVLTTYGTDDQILAAVEAGATGYLLKHADLSELLQAIRGAASGETILAPSVAARLTRHLRNPKRSTLSARETEVLRLVARGLTNAAIGSALFISEATVKTHLLRIFGKLKVDDRTAAVMTAVGRGLITVEE